MSLNRFVGRNRSRMESTTSSTRKGTTSATNSSMVRSNSTTTNVSNSTTNGTNTTTSKKNMATSGSRYPPPASRTRMTTSGQSCNPPPTSRTRSSTSGPNPPSTSRRIEGIRRRRQGMKSVRSSKFPIWINVSEESDFEETLASRQAAAAKRSQNNTNRNTANVQSQTEVNVKSRRIQTDAQAVNVSVEVQTDATSSTPGETDEIYEEPAADDGEETVLFIGHLAESVHNGALKKLFRSFGHCRVWMPKGRHAENYAFVTFFAKSNAERAIKKLHGTLFEGKRVQVVTAKNPKKNATAPTSDVRPSMSFSFARPTTTFARSPQSSAHPPPSFAGPLSPEARLATSSAGRSESFARPPLRNARSSTSVACPPVLH